MEYLYGTFSNKQITEAARLMHNDVHKLLLYKDKKIEEIIFNTEEDFFNYYDNLLFKFGGLNELLGEPDQMVMLMSTLQAALDDIQSDHYNYKTFRKAILDSHGYIKAMFEEVDENAKSDNS